MTIRIGSSGTVSTTRPIIGASCSVEGLAPTVAVGASCTLTVHPMAVEIGGAAHLNARNLDEGTGTLIGTMRGRRVPA